MLVCTTSTTTVSVEAAAALAVAATLLMSEDTWMVERSTALTSMATVVVVAKL